MNSPGWREAIPRVHRQSCHNPVRGWPPSLKPGTASPLRTSQPKAPDCWENHSSQSGTGILPVTPIPCESRSAPRPPTSPLRSNPEPRGSLLALAPLRPSPHHPSRLRVRPPLRTRTSPNQNAPTAHPNAAQGNALGLSRPLPRALKGRPSRPGLSLKVSSVHELVHSLRVLIRIPDPDSCTPWTPAPW